MADSITADHDRILTLEGRTTNIEKRINGHVPDRCIRTDEMLQTIMADIKEIKDKSKSIWQSITAPLITGVVVGLVVAFLSKVHL